MTLVSPRSASAPPLEPDFARIFPALRAAGEWGEFELFESDDLLLGWTSKGTAAGLEPATREVYRQVLEATEGRHLYRIWNQVPQINAVPAGTGLENYRAFSLGRSMAFEEFFGEGFAERLPAASAVGTRSADLTVAFVAGRAHARHFENPQQTPAYRYPAEHGPRSPSFARATAASSAGRKVVFVSGTAAIKGHETVAPQSLARQVDCTLDNLGLILSEAGAGSAGWKRHFKVYVRADEDFAFVREALAARLFVSGDDVAWRHADLCRAALKVEIEASLVAA